MRHESYTEQGEPLMLQIKKLDPSAELPFRATPNSIGLDLRAHLVNSDGRQRTAMIGTGEVKAIPTGLAVRPPNGYAAFVMSRSGLARDQSLFVANAPGVVDPDYTGEIVVLLYNGGFVTRYIQHGMRIAQIVLLPAPVATMMEVNELPETVRGDRGFGSSGVE